MFWIITGVVLAVLFGIAWWTSGRSRPLTRRTGRSDTLNDSYARAIAQAQTLESGNRG